MNSSTLSQIASISRPSAMAADVAAGIVSALQEHRLFLGLSAAYIVCATIGVALIDGAPAPMIGHYLYQYSFGFGLYLLLLTGFSVWQMCLVGIFHSPEERAGVLLTRCLRRNLPDRRSCYSVAVSVLLVTPVVLSVFTSLKNAFPTVRPFAWDETLSQIDFILHGGSYPHEILQPFVGFPAVTAVIEFAYAFWGVVMLFGTFWLASRPERRRRYLIAHLLTWTIVGSIAAVGLSSAGPCYYGRVTGLPDPYAPLMSYLHGASGLSGASAVVFQEYLWHFYAVKQEAAFTGISAMPSMHVAIATLLVLAFWNVARWIRYAMLAFAATIIVGSVHLGWHYAVDGYVAIVLTFLAWKFAGSLDRLPGRRTLQADA